MFYHGIYYNTPNDEAIEGCVLVIQLSGSIEQHHPQCTDSHTVTLIASLYGTRQCKSNKIYITLMHVLQKPPVLRWWST